VITFSYALSSATAAFAGVLVAPLTLTGATMGASLGLKAFAVAIIGGLTSGVGAIVGGLIIGASEKLAEVYIGPMVGGGIETWFAYGLALAFLLVRPQGLFGDKIIDRV
ncbi:MAG: branched-chain amino acid ABC transporter permease, partial [Comamonas sp.]